MLSRGEFTTVATPRVLDLLKRQKILASFAVPGHTAYAFPQLMARIRDEGHEFVHHGWVHENPADFDESGERLILERGIEAIYKTAGVKPVGYISPANDFSKTTLKLLNEFGFLYDGSFFGDDFNAYYARINDSWSSDTPYQFGEIVDLVELPWSWHLDDFPCFEFVLGFNSGLLNPDEVEKVWKSEFEFAYNHCPDGIFILTMHPETIGRGARLLMLERFIEFAKGHSDVAFDTAENYARTWKGRNPIKQWCAANPMRVGSESIRAFPS
jgi:peptidoglycan-N-acetylglucosamine deacetylase